MSTQPLDLVPLGVFFVLSIGVLVLALEGGYWFGRRRHVVVPGEKESSVASMVASILGLLAIMLAFTFNLAASRFDLRRQVVLEEANAIGTTYLRARLLPEPQRGEAEGLLREYIDLRLTVSGTKAVEEKIRQSEEIQGQLWSRAVAVSEQAPDSIPAGLFVQSLNGLIDIHAKRIQVGMRSRLPVSLWLALFLLVIVGMLSVGYQAGLAATRRSPAELLLALSFAVVLNLIVDLDRSQEGLLQVDQAALQDQKRSMQLPR